MVRFSDLNPGAQIVAYSAAGPNFTNGKAYLIYASVDGPMVRDDNEEPHYFDRRRGDIVDGFTLKSVIDLEAARRKTDYRRLGEAAFDAMREAAGVPHGGALFSAVAGFVIKASTTYPHFEFHALRRPQDDPDIAAEIAFLRGLSRHLTAVADELCGIGPKALRSAKDPS